MSCRLMAALNPRRSIVLVIMTLFVFSPFCITRAVSQTPPTDLDGMKVALYYGGSTSAESRTALQFMFSWMNP